MRQKRFPPGWDEDRVRRVLAHYEDRTEEEAVAEDEAAAEEPDQTVMEVPIGMANRFESDAAMGGAVQPQRWAGGRGGRPDWTGVSRGRSGPVARNRIGPEQKREALEDIAHSCRSQDADSVSESRLVDGSDLGDVYDAGTRKSCFTLPQAHVARHGSKPEVRCDCRDDSGRDGASIETVVLYDESGAAAGRC